MGSEYYDYLGLSDISSVHFVTDLNMCFYYNFRNQQTAWGCFTCIVVCGPFHLCLVHEGVLGFDAFGAMIECSTGSVARAATAPQGGRREWLAVWQPTDAGSGSDVPTRRSDGVCCPSW